MTLPMDLTHLKAAFLKLIRALRIADMAYKSGQLGSVKPSPKPPKQGMSKAPSVATLSMLETIQSRMEQSEGVERTDHHVSLVRDQVRDIVSIIVSMFQSDGV